MKQKMFLLKRWGQSNAGFTIIELVVAMGITLILATVILANFRTGERSRRVQFAADQIVQDFRSIQNSVQTGAVQLNNPACPKGKIPDNLYVTIQANSTGYDIKATDKCLNSNFIVRNSVLPQQTRIKSLTFDGSPASLVTVKVNPPFAVMKACFGSDCNPVSAFTEIKIIVESSADSSLSRTVTVNGLSGQITQ